VAFVVAVVANPVGRIARQGALLEHVALFLAIAASLDRHVRFICAFRFHMALFTTVAAPGWWLVGTLLGKVTHFVASFAFNIGHVAFFSTISGTMTWFPIKLLQSEHLTHL
jgi:hypothetical protein